VSTDAPVRRDATPWSDLDSSASLWPAALGVLLLGWSWWEASGSAILDDQTGSAVIGILGTGISCYALASWLRAGRRAVDRRRRHLMDLAAEAVHHRTGDQVQLVHALPTDAGLVTYVGAQRYHRSECLLVARKATVAADAAVVASTRPCEMCRP
jgi:hypothetical protein